MIYADTFWTNPQFRTEVTDADEGDDEELGTVIVALMQKERRKKKAQGLDYLTIGFCVYKVVNYICILFLYTLNLIRLRRYLFLITYW